MTILNERLTYTPRLTRETRELLSQLFPVVLRRDEIRDVATWHPVTDDETGETMVRLTITTWGPWDAVSQEGATLPDLRAAWAVVAAMGVVHPDKVSDTAAFRAWCVMGRR